MPEVIELRVHGVGGTPPEELLGEPRPGGLVRVGGEAKSAFYARVREGRRVEGYAWGALTSSGLVQPLWIFLLPFTLVNVAGWMVRPRAEARAGWIWHLSRALVYLLGILLTLDYLYGLSVLITRQLLFEWGVREWGLEPRTAVWIGTGVVFLLGLLVIVVAFRKHAQFEAVDNPLGVPARQQPEPGTSNRVLSTLRGIPSTVGRTRQRLFPRAEERLGDATFWASVTPVRTLLVVHLWFALVTLLALALRAQSGIGDGTGQLTWRSLFLSSAILQMVVLGLLSVVLVLGFKRPLRLFSEDYFRILGPAVTISTAIGLTGGLFVGASLALQKALRLQGGLEVDLGLAFGAASVSTVVAAALVFVHLMGRSTSHAAEIVETGPHESSALPGEEPNGLPEGARGSLARARALSEFGRNVGFVLTVPAVVFWGTILTSFQLADLEERRPFLLLVAILVTASLVAAFLLARPRFKKGTGAWPMVTILAIVGVALLVLGWRFDGDVTVETVGELGGTIAFAGTVGFLAFWVRGYFKPEQRRIIAIIWDVATFFPRLFHPLAVRPYAERAVPELTGRILHHLGEDRRVILSAHSQGTVLGFGALDQIRRSDKEQGGRRLSGISYLTYGSPLNQLHARFFPAYFSSAFFNDVERELFDGQAQIDERHSYPASWRNFYRRTDYIGKEVDVGMPVAARNAVVPDPPEGPSYGKGPDTPLEDAGPDPARPAWVGLSLHSYYNSDPALKTWVEALRRTMEAP